ncbi:MAG TPA: LysR substrate-binding domain-containing protein [Sandaracinaceae bacterium]
MLRAPPRSARPTPGLRRIARARLPDRERHRARPSPSRSWSWSKRCSARRARPAPPAGLHVTQSAVPNALRRAREIFGSSRRAHRTRIRPDTEGRAPPSEARRAPSRSSRGARGRGGRPNETARRFTIACTDALSIVLVPRLLARFRRCFPRASLRVVTLDRALAGGLDAAEVDLLIGAPPGCESALLFEDRMVALVSADNAEVGRRLALATYARSLTPSSLSSASPTVPSIARWPNAGSSAASTSAFRASPRFPSSSRAATGSPPPSSASRALAAPHGLRVLSPPVELELLSVRMVWHRRVAADPAVAPLRELVRQSCPKVRGRA